MYKKTITKLLQTLDRFWTGLWRSAWH